MASPAELECFDDPKYRSFAAQVEKALKNFEYSAEWADLISALVKLNKVLQANATYEILPKRITIGKRLSQCLHPALPGGVHLKALDVYDTIFKIIGQKRLRVDLCIYGAGIFSLLANASMQVRPVLLNVYETHLLPLGENLRTSLDGLLLGLLPGLEEGSEHFDRINLLLDKISRCVGLQYFYGSIWRCVLSSPSSSIVRLAAMQLILRQFDKRKMTDDQLYLIGLDIDMMVQAVCEALQDENVLTQRATLDVLLFCFPLSSLPVSRSDAQTILSSAIFVLLRRDMSLNRRLYSWILGVDLNKGVSASSKGVKKSVAQYFEQNSKMILMEAVFEMIEKHAKSFTSACCGVTVQGFIGTEVKFFRILISLLDKQEVGPVIINDIFVGVLRLIENVSRAYNHALFEDSLCCKKCSLTPDTKDNCVRGHSEFVKSVNLFVGSFETDFIWGFVAEKFGEVCKEAPNNLSERSPSEGHERLNFSYHELCSVIETLLRILSIEMYADIQTILLPQLLDKIFIALKDGSQHLSGENLVTGLRLCSEIMRHIQPFRPSDSNHVEAKHTIATCTNSYKEFFASFITLTVIKDEDSLHGFMADFRKKSARDVYQSGLELMQLGETKNRQVQFESYGRDNSAMLQAFKDSCKVLIDICCFPTLSHRSSTLSLILRTKQELPEWAASLVACACCSEYTEDDLFPNSQSDIEYFSEISITACATVLELMALTASNRHSGLGAAEHEASVVSVYVPPPLSLSHLSWLYEETSFYERICEILWRGLGVSNTVPNSSIRHQTCSQLLVLLHQLCPDETVERLLLQDILAVEEESRVGAVEKFTKLWHYMRDGGQNFGPSSLMKSSKTFSRCLFAVLDQLVVERYSLFPDLTSANTKGQAIVSTCVSNWLRHVLEEGDLCRILEPYILISLHAGTHRKSLQSMLQFNREYSDYEHPHDEYSLFLEKQNRDVYLECEECLEVQRDADNTSMSNYQNLSIDSVMTYALCEVHQQLSKERHRYEHLVALLTLSDELECEGGLKSPHVENDLNRWAQGFVNMIIRKGISLYKAQSGNAERLLSELSDDVGNFASSQHLAVEASEQNYSSAESEVSQATEAIELNLSFDKNQNPLYQHILIYQEQFDANRVLYSLQGILAIASAHPGVFIHSACTTSLASEDGPYSNLIQELLVRHERTIEQGKSFYEPTSPSLKGAMRNRMLVEVLVSICLYYMRSGFPAFRKVSGISAELNHEVQCIATQLLAFVVKELTLLAQQEATASINQAAKFPSSTKQLSAYIVLVLQRHQVQSSVLTCLLTTIYAIKDPDKEESNPSIPGTVSTTNSDFSELELCRDDKVIKRYLGGSVQQATTLFSHFLSLAFDLVKLEHFAFPVKPKAPTTQGSPAPGPSIILNRRERQKMKPKVKRSLRLISHLLSLAYQYDSDSPIAVQKVFVSSILEIYKLENHLELQQQCSTHLVSNLQYLGNALSSIVTPVILHQCLNLENMNKNLLTYTAVSSPPSYIESTIKSVAALVHCCLLTESTNKSTERNVDASQADNVSVSASKMSQATTGSIGSGLSTLLSVFNSSSSAKASITSNDSERFDGLAAAKVAVLNNLAVIVSCVCTLWRDIVSQAETSVVSAEEAKGVSFNILQFLGPLAIQYGEYLLVAFALVWQNRSAVEESKKLDLQMPNSLIKSTKDHENIADLLLAIKLLSVEMFFSLIKQVVRSPPPVTNEPKSVTLQESVLQMLLSYMKHQKPVTLTENWPGFLAILQETLALAQIVQPPAGPDGPTSPNCCFLSLYLLAEYVRRTSPFTQKKEQREIQEIAGKCIEVCNLIAGSSLEQGTWIRRNVSVLPGPQVPEGTIKMHRKTESQSSIDITETHNFITDAPPDTPLHTSSSDTLITSAPQKLTTAVSEAESNPRPDSAKERPTSLPQISNSVLNAVNFRNSLKALTVLSEVVANLLDVIYGSEDKEKVVPVLASIMTNVTPYLRNHSTDNIPSFVACVSFLSSISGFQHTRRAWRKDVIDLFLDTPFFHMPAECIEGWMAIIDNLMTHDKLTFKEIMSRTSLSRTGPTTPTLNIFSNKEQELELRALHIKRLAFIVFSSEKDQYQKQLPDIQERLAESLRFPNVPGIQNRVFLCFRILILRVSPHSLTSLWPTMFTELVHVMLQLEQAMDTTFAEDNNSKGKHNAKVQNGMASPSTPRTVMTCWLDMYLSACKLLDVALCLPVRYVPQFQLYRWSFVGDAPSEPLLPESKFQQNGPTEKQEEKADKPPDPKFIPHCVRIQRLFSVLHPERANKLLPIVPGKPLLSITRLKSIDQLQLFFNTITSPTHLLLSQSSMRNSRHRRKDSLEATERLPLVEKALHKDFIRPML